MGENIVCAVIDVDCYPNTPELIKYGAPPYVGFEFWVKKKDRQVMTDFVKCALHEYGVQIIHIDNSHAKIVNEDDIHTPEKIIDVIERNKDHLFDECEYYYRKRCK